jgi:hypothetical protein
VRRVAICEGLGDIFAQEDAGHDTVDFDDVHARPAAQAVARGAMRTIGRDWSDPPAGWLFRHRWRDGGSCPRCGAGLVRETLRGRTACHCPGCQAA